MLKKILKTNNTVSFLIFLSFIIVINNFFRFFQNKTAHQFVPWLSNYQGGFVRRGLPGELLYQIHNFFNIHLGWIVFIFVLILYFSFYFLFFKLIKNLKLNAVLIFAFLSPLAFYYPVLNSKATGHKEIIFLLFLSFFCFILPKITKLQAVYLVSLMILFIGLSHDGLVVFSAYLIIPALLFFEFKHFKQLLINILPIFLVILILILTIYIFKGSEKHVIAICESIKIYAHNECQNIGKISALKFSIGDPLVQKSKLVYGGYSVYPSYFLIYGIGFILGFLPLIILYNRSNLTKLFFNKKINALYILFVPWLLTFPIYYIAADWGRYLYISYMSSLIILIFCLKNKIFIFREIKVKFQKSKTIKILFVTSLIIYGFGWTVPVCCEKKIKFGIYDATKRVIFYYNKKK